jgi:hypothetical protein
LAASVSSDESPMSPATCSKYQSNTWSHVQYGLLSIAYDSPANSSFSIARRCPAIALVMASYSSKDSLVFSSFFSLAWIRLVLWQR